MTQITELINEYKERIARRDEIIRQLDVQITNEDDSAVRLAELRASKDKALTLRDAFAEFISELEEMTAS